MSRARNLADLLDASGDVKNDAMDNVALSDLDVTATAAEVNIMDGVTATTAELNIMDGVTATTAELNLLDGVTATTAELNYVDGVTSNIQTQIDGITQATGNELENVSEDTTPQLGGNLDVAGNSIVSASNGDINITPNGTGSVVIDGLSHPQSDGTADQLLKTDGAGNLSFTDAPSSDLVDDTSPQLGGSLLANGNTIDMEGNELILDADGDTSITADTDDRIDFRVGGNDRMYLNSNGFISIGRSASTTISRPLHIKDASPNIRLEDSDGSGQYADLGSDTGGSIYYLADHGNSGAGTMHRFYVDGGERMRFNNASQLLINGEGGGSLKVDVRQGSAKMWNTMELEGTFSTYDSYNVSSNTDRGTGKYQLNFSNVFNNSNYAMACGTAETTGTDNYARMTTAASVRRSTNFSYHWSHLSTTGAASDLRYVCNIHHGDLA